MVSSSGLPSISASASASSSSSTSTSVSTPTLPSGEPTIRVLAMPADTNPSGDIFGGWIMSQVDIAASIVAHRRARSRTVTVAVDSFLFKKPVFVGDLVSCYGRVTKVGTTSITVMVEVYAERNRQDTEVMKVTEATLIFVAVDAEGKPMVVPELMAK
ncbi:MAG: acyl-CoA thioesterase [Ectothiorhodospiraceae bacterium]|nr:acyl-CoA thioesterase [Ectothiorhodospiraceae bacterium]